MRKKPVGTIERYVVIGHQTRIIHLAAPLESPLVNADKHAARVAQLTEAWGRQGIKFIDGCQTAAGKAAQQALDEVRRFIPSERRHMPLLDAVKRKRNKYPKVRP